MVLSEKLITAQIFIKFAAIHGTRRFITVLKRTNHWSLP
jgi:hypothetical protein